MTKMRKGKAPPPGVSALRRPLGDLPDPLPIPPLARPFNITLVPPGSKSLTNRALLLAALGEGDSIIRNPLLDADDAKRMLKALRRLGIETEVHPSREWVIVHGAGGELQGDVEINLNNAGTATRFLTAAAALADGPVTIDGNERMRQRPIGELVAFLRALGIEVEDLGAPGCVPLRVHGQGSLAGGELTIPTTASSQYVSALLMIAPLCAQGLTLRFEGEITSKSYIDMTVGLMANEFGVTIEASEHEIHVPPGPIASIEYEVEADASSAGYFWAAAAMTPKARTRIPGLTFQSLQADARLPMVLRQMGAPIEYDAGGAEVHGAKALEGVDVDLAAMPDAAMTVAAVACFARGASTLRGLRTLRVKESDRLAATQAELTKIGAHVTIEGDDALRIQPPTHMTDAPITFDTYDDHRMAMSLSLIGLRRPNVSINDPRCVDKTFPGFWEALSMLHE
ncbi:MAG: 3-phosphoshikimate 1-carboxyvinyltransferase [Phycisphaerales bacterium]|nr:3-phosphoshikimate 1-carboxyvinyltransferase [Phycisphaerales bacterium]